MKSAAEKERQAQARENRRARRTKPRTREIGAQIMKENRPAEVVELRSRVVTSDIEADARMLAATIAPQFALMVARYNRHDLAPEDRERFLSPENRLRNVAEAKDCPPDRLTWSKLSDLAEAEGLQAAVEVWLKVQHFALDELESGMRCAQASGHTTPMARARYLAVREQFINQWEPTGGIDMALIEMLAQSFSLYLYWTQISHIRATTVCDNTEEVQLKTDRHNWKMPYQMVRDSIDEAHQMADRYNRIFLRTLRQMRDLRRYSTPPAPVTPIINNGGQVNLANQQMNVKG